MNAKRGLTHHALSIAVADGPTMADVVFGYVYDLGPGEEWCAHARRRRLAQRRAAGDAAARAPQARRARSSSSRSSRPTRAGWPPPATRSCDVTGRLRAIGSIAVSLCQVAADARGRHGDAVEVPRGRRRRRRSSSSARAAASSPSRRWTIRSARRSTSSRARRSWPPAPTAALAELATAARRALMVDWRLRRAGRRRPSPAATGADAAAAGGDLDAMADDARASASSRTRARARRAPLPPPEAVDRKAWARRRTSSTHARHARAADRGRLGTRARCSRARRRAHRRRGRRDRRLHGPRACSASTSSRCSIPSARRGCCSSRPNLREAARAFEADERELLAWVVFHEVTHAVQFTGVPWLREHLASLLRELLASVKVEVDAGGAAAPAQAARTCARRVDAVRDGRPRRTRSPGPSARSSSIACRRRWRSSRATPSTSWTPPARRCCRRCRKLREALERRRREKPPLVKLLERLLGLELKMRQYERRQALLRRRRRDWRDRGPQPRLERSRARCRRSRSSTTRPPGCARTRMSVVCNAAAPTAVYGKHVFAW